MKHSTGKSILQSNLAIRNFLVALKLLLLPKVPDPYEVNGKLVTGNGSLIQICFLSNRSLLPSLTVLLFSRSTTASNIYLVDFYTTGTDKKYFMLLLLNT